MTLAKWHASTSSSTKIWPISATNSYSSIHSESKYFPKSTIWIFIFCIIIFFKKNFRIMFINKNITHPIMSNNNSIGSIILLIISTMECNIIIEDLNNFWYGAVFAYWLFFEKKNDRKYAFYTTFKSNLLSTYFSTWEGIIMLKNENTFFIQFCNHRNCYVISSNYSTSHKKKFKNVAFSLSELSFLNCNFFFWILAFRY